MSLSFFLYLSFFLSLSLSCTLCVIHANTHSCTRTRTHTIYFFLSKFKIAISFHYFIVELRPPSSPTNRIVKHLSQSCQCGRCCQCCRCCQSSQQGQSRGEIYRPRHFPGFQPLRSGINQPQSGGKQLRLI